MAGCLKGAAAFDGEVCAHFDGHEQSQPARFDPDPRIPISDHPHAPARTGVAAVSGRLSRHWRCAPRRRAAGGAHAESGALYAGRMREREPAAGCAPSEWYCAADATNSRGWRYA